MRICLVPNNCMRCDHRADSNCDPLSVVIVDGTPNLEIQPLTKVLATVSAVILVIGMASGQRVKWSTHVSRYEYPFDDGSGPTISM